MRRGLVRLLMVAVGVLSFVVYAGGAYVAFVVLYALWLDRPSAGETVLVLVGVTLVGGYVAYRIGTRRLLSSIAADELTRDRAPGLYRRLDPLAERVGVAAPRLFVGDLGEPNAFAVGGPEGGAIVVDDGLFDLLDADELDGVLAHELAHLASRDDATQTVAFAGMQTIVEVALLFALPLLLVLTGVAKATAWIRGTPTAWSRTFAGRFRTLLTGLAFVLPAGLALAILARSRRREYAADDAAVRATGDPIALATALQKIERAAAAVVPVADAATAPPDENGLLVRLLATHPAIDARIDRLAADIDARRSTTP